MLSRPPPPAADLQHTNHRRGSSYQSSDAYAPIASLQEYNNSIVTTTTSSSSASSTPTRSDHDRKKRENAFNKPRPSLLPYQEYHSGFDGSDDLGGDQQYHKEGKLGSPFTASPTKTHARQFSNFLPLSLTRSGSRTPSPVRKTPVSHSTEEAEDEYSDQEETEMGYTGDNRSSKGTVDSPLAGLNNWFNPNTRERGLSMTESSYSARSTTPTTTPRHRKTSSFMIPSPFDSNQATPRNAASRFMSVLSSKLNIPISPATSTPTQYTPETDELYTLDPSTSLCPPGTDPFSPAAFKNLQQTSIGLLTRYQTAYRQQHQTIRDLEAERAASRDELEEAVTRASHLRSQLEGMAAKAAEQEDAMRELMATLMSERKMREEERQRGLGREGDGASMLSYDTNESGGRQMWRATDSSFDTETEDDESVSDSLFSGRNRSSPPSTVEEGSVDLHRRMVSHPDKNGMVRGHGRQMSTFQKIVRGVVEDVQEIVGALGGDDEEIEEEYCDNCRGGDANVAWSTVGVLRDENKALKGRVGELENAVEGALDLVSGRGYW